jgi:hypothetical protein
MVEDHLRREVHGGYAMAASLEEPGDGSGSGGDVEHRG